MKLNYLLILVLLAGLLIVPASATITITPSDITTSSIMWTWDSTTITNLSIDGIFVCNFNPAATNFTLSDLGPNEPHTISIITAGDSGTNTATTLGNTNSDLISTWWYLVLILILCVVGMMRKLGIFLPVASAVSTFALVTFLSANTPADGNPLVQIPFIIYLIFIVIPLWLCFGVKGGVFK